IIIVIVALGVGAGGRKAMAWHVEIGVSDERSDSALDGLGGEELAAGDDVAPALLAQAQYLLLHGDDLADGLGRTGEGEAAILRRAAGGLTIVVGIELSD